MDIKKQHFQLLGELDARQNDVLRQLEDLDRRVKRVLDECLGKRKSSRSPLDGK